MKILLDAQLPRSLAKQLQSRVVFSKDADFLQSHLLLGSPARLLSAGSHRQTLIARRFPWLGSPTTHKPDGYGADQPIATLLHLRDAVAIEHPAHHPLDALRVVINLGHVFAQDPPGDVLRRGWAAAAEQLHQHQRLVDGAHPHPLG